METFFALTFTDKKNAVCSQVIGRSYTGSNLACATQAIGRRISHFRSHHAAPCTSLCVYSENDTCIQVTIPVITHALHLAASLVGAAVRYFHEDVYCHFAPVWLGHGYAMCVNLFAHNKITWLVTLRRYALTIFTPKPTPLTNDISSGMLQFGGLLYTSQSSNFIVGEKIYAHSISMA